LAERESQMFKAQAQAQIASASLKRLF